MRTWLIDTARYRIISGPPPAKEESVKVIELEPMLDLLETTYELYIKHIGIEQQILTVNDILRENGRLQ